MNHTEKNRTFPAARLPVASLVSAGILLVFLFCSLMLPPVLFAADEPGDFTDPPGANWAQLFLDQATAYSIALTDTGYIAAGAQTGDPWPYIWAAMVKLDWVGNIQDWATFEGEDHPNLAYDVIPNFTPPPLAVDGYVIAGYMHQNDDVYYDPHVWIMKTGLTLDKDWGHTFGNAFDDWGNSLLQDASGYVIGGWNGIGGPSGSGWLIHTNSAGTVDWEAIADVSDPTTWWMSREVESVRPCSDGGYVLATESGIVKAAAGTPPTFGWEADSSNSYAFAQQTTDGGYIGVGTIEGAGGSDQVLLKKLNAAGGTQWTHTYGVDSPVPGLGSPPDDRGMQVIQTTDGGYAVVGTTQSYGFPEDEIWFYGHGGTDIWLIKTDPSGAVEWDTALGGEGADRGHSLVEAPAGGLCVAGSATYLGTERMWLLEIAADFSPPIPSFTYTPASPVFVSETVTFNASASTDPDGTIEGYAWNFGDGSGGTGMETGHVYLSPGDYTVTLYVTDSDGLVRSASQPIQVVDLAVQWERWIDNTGDNVGFSIVQAPDGGFVIAGYTFTSAYGGSAPDGWLYKVDAYGEDVWERRYADYDNFPEKIQTFHGIANTPDTGFIVTGQTDTGIGEQMTQLWLFKTDSTGVHEWNSVLGGPFRDEGNGVALAHGGGYIVTGLTGTDTSHVDDIGLWLLKTTAAGALSWDQVFPDPEFFEGTSVLPTSDLGYLVTGAYANGVREIPLIKTDGLGVEDWHRDFAGSGVYDRGNGVFETAAEDGYVLVGALDEDAGLIGTGTDGYEDWRVTYGGDDLDTARSAARTPDGGFILAGSTVVTSPPDDLYLVKTDDGGALEWERVFSSGTDYDNGQGVIAMADGSYVVMANSGGDVWLFKIGANRLPTAAFTFAPPEPAAAELITFDASPSTDSDGVIASYDWDFGNGDGAAGEEVDYAYPTGGNYTVTLTVTDEDGGRASTTQEVEVTGTPFVLLSPAHGSPLGSAPTLNWTSGDYDFYRVVLFLHLFGTYYPIWIPTFSTSMDLALYGDLWDFITTGTPGGWGVLGINTGTLDFEFTGLWWFVKTGP